MTLQLAAAHRSTLRQETAVSTAINALVPAAIIWLLDVNPPQRLVGQDAILAAMIPASGLATLIMTVVLTLIVRARVAAGSVPQLIWPRSERGAYRFIPQALLLRAAFLAVLAIILLVPLGWLITAGSNILPLTRLGALAFNIVFGAAVGLLMTRFVVLPALADGSAQ